MSPLPDWLDLLYEAAEMRAADAWAIEKQGVPQDDLMERSRQEAARFLADREQSSDADGDDDTDVTTIPEMSVEVDLRDTPAHQTRLG